VRPLIASDLDRTLIYSVEAMTLGDPVAQSVCVEVFEGREVSFMAAGAAARLVEVASAAEFVPITTRTVAQYDRIVLPSVRVGYAITTNGACLLVGGIRCPDWDTEITARLADFASYDEAVVVFASAFDRPWVRKVRDAEKYFLYTVFERSTAEPDWFAELAEIATGLGWALSVQGRKAYVVPQALTKEVALAEVVRRVGATQVVAAGDSLLDRGLLEYADIAIRPAHGELHEADWTPPGLAVTTCSGGKAGEEIIEFFARQSGPIRAETNR
jgi:hypothetical protein